MKPIQTVIPDDLRVIVCLAFDHRVAPHEIAACKAAVVSCPSVLHSVELSGTYDFMFEATVPDMEGYRTQLSSCAGAVAKFASRYEANFVCKRFVRANATECAIWVPSVDGLMRIDCSVIDKVTAQGDYVLVHSSGRSWMLHTTMQDIEEKLGSEHFLRVHRSTILRHGFIERLRHEGRIWTARLNDGSVQRISNRYVVDVLAKLRAKSSTSQLTSSKRARSAEAAADAERMMQAQPKAA
jgi:hypothetical protein